MGIEDILSVSVVNSSLIDDNWVTSFRIRTYEIPLLETNQQLLNDYFANDRADLTAPIKEVYVDYNGASKYYIITNTLVSLTGYNRVPVLSVSSS